MNAPLPTDDQYVDQLSEWEARLQQGETVPPGASSVVTDEKLAQRLDRGLACLKLLNGLRRNGDSVETRLVSGESKFTPLKYKLPCRFGKFNLLSELGRGGFGVVFLAKDLVLEANVAIKMPHGHVLANDHLRERFRREARVAAGLEHANIVTVREAGEVGPVSFIVYSYCRGITLAEWLRQQKEQVPAQLAATWLAELAEAVAYAHQSGVCHRDLKPTNILLHATSTADGSGYVPKITDFGLAKLDREEGQTASGVLLGTPQYMAPEQVTRTDKLAPPVDIHALGVILYELLAGHPPYRGETDFETLQLVQAAEPLPLRQMRPRLSRDLETICLKCLQKDPCQRYASAADLAADLRRYLKHEPIHARPVSVVERACRRCRRHPLVTALTAALLFALTAGVAGFLWQQNERNQQADAAYAWLTKCQELVRRDVQSAQEMMLDIRTEKQGRERLLKSLEFVDSLLRDPLAQSVLRLEAGRVAFQAGNIHMSLGQYKQAVSRFQQAADHFDHAPASSGGRSGLILEKGQVLFRLAQVYRNLQKWDFSEFTYGQAIKHVQQILQKDPDHAEALAFTANCLVYNCVNLRNQKRHEESEQNYQSAVRHIERAQKQRPDDASLLLVKALVHDDYAAFCMDLNRLDEAEKHARLGLELRQAACGPAPTLPSQQEVLARSHWRMALLLAKTERPEEAEKHYGISITMNDKLRSSSPNVAMYAHNSAFDRMLLASLLERRERLLDAEDLYRQAITIRKQGLIDFPDMQVNQAELVRLHSRLSGLLKKLNRHTEAEHTRREGARLNEEYEMKYPKQQ
jgi:tetratricopeptide (TPR) repeat protein